MAHAYNPSYSGGRDQEARGSKPVPVNSWQNPTSKKKKKNLHKKAGLLEWLKVKALSSSSNTKKKKKNLVPALQSIFLFVFLKQCLTT
jgi:hypothetical protein